MCHVAQELVAVFFLFFMKSIGHIFLFKFSSNLKMLSNRHVATNVIFSSFLGFTQNGK